MGRCLYFVLYLLCPHSPLLAFLGHPGNPQQLSDSHYGMGIIHSRSTSPFAEALIHISADINVSGSPLETADKTGNLSKDKWPNESEENEDKGLETIGDTTVSFVKHTAGPETAHNQDDVDIQNEQTKMLNLTGQGQRTSLDGEISSATAAVDIAQRFSEKTKDTITSEQKAYYTQTADTFDNFTTSIVPVTQDTDIRTEEVFSSTTTYSPKRAQKPESMTSTESSKKESSVETSTTALPESLENSNPNGLQTGGKNGMVWSWEMFTFDDEPKSNITNIPVVELAGEVVPVCDLKNFCINQCGDKTNNVVNLSDGQELHDRRRRYVKNTKYTLYIPGMKISTAARDGEGENADDIIQTKDLLHQYGSSRNPWSVEDAERRRDANTYLINLWSGVLDEEAHRSKRSSDKICRNSYLQGKRCSCDALCVIYGDCCIDVFANCFELFQTDLVFSFIDDMSYKLNPDNALEHGIVQAMNDNPQDADKIVAFYESQFGSCEKVKSNGASFVKLISQCPNSFQDPSLIEKCEGNTSSSLMPPVTATLQSRDAFFKNNFCALCHGVGEDDTKAWDSLLHCNETIMREYKGQITVEVLEKFVESDYCIIKFTPKSGSCNPRVCDPEMMITKEDEELLSLGVADGLCTPDDLKLCKTYISPRLGLRNLHCKRCLQNSTRVERDTSYLVCDDVIFPTLDDLPGLMLILDITGNYVDYGGKAIASYSCGETEVFEPSSQLCKQLFCALGYEPYYGECQKVSDVHFVDPVTQLYPGNWSELKMDFTKSDVKLACHVLASKLPSSNVTLRSYVLSHQQDGNLTQISHEIELLPDRRVHCLEETLGGVGMNMIVDEMTVSLNSNFFSTLDNLEIIVKQALPLPFLFVNDSSEVRLTTSIKSETLTCPLGGVLAEVTDFTIQDFKGKLYAKYNTSGQVIQYPLHNIGFERVYYMDATKNFVLSSSDTILVCESMKLLSNSNCSVVVYWLNETSVNDSTLFVLSSGMYYDKEYFEVIRHQVFVCSDFKANKQSRHLQDNVPYLIVSWVFTVVAILFLLTMVVCYCLFPELCTLPGKMTASLAGTMMFTFLFNLFTLVELHHQYVCPVAAALSHLVTLAHFGWMSAIAVNMALTFGPGSISRINTLNNKKAFMRYNVVVWGSSFITVLASVILDIVHSDSSSEPQNQTQFADKNTDVYSEKKTRPGLLASSSSSFSSSVDFPRYGYPYCTWFSGPIWSRLAFVVIPYFITFLINVVSFILTLVGIQLSSRGSARLGKKSNDRIRCLIYIKLSTAMGFSWSLSLLTNFVEKNEVLPYIYITLVLLQGVLLFLAFMVNKRVYGLITSRGAALVEKTKTTSLSAVQSQDTRSKNIL